METLLHKCRFRRATVAISAATVLLAQAACTSTASAPPSPAAAPEAATPPAATPEAERLPELPPVGPRAKGIDHSGRTQKGEASYYGPGFAHKKMANGNRMNPHSDSAASKTLPLGTTAKVTNLENGNTATVKIEDRGPFVDGRVVDLTPTTAGHLDMKHQGVAPVAVKPIAVPQKDGDVKLGSGAAESTPEEVQRAVQETRRLTGQPETAAATK